MWCILVKGIVNFFLKRYRAPVVNPIFSDGWFGARVSTRLWGLSVYVDHGLFWCLKFLIDSLYSQIIMGLMFTPLSYNIVQRQKWGSHLSAY